MPHVAIVTSVVPGRAGRRWGDWSYARALGRALGRRGVVTSLHDRSGPGADVPDEALVLCLRGLLAAPDTGGRALALWVISHPADVLDDELDQADLVFAASASLTTTLAGRSSTPAVTLLQAADVEAFADARPSARYDDPVVVVANTRGQFRPSVRDALAAGLAPVVYGRGWDKFIDSDLVRRRHVGLERLGRIYASAGVVVNDHWPDMRDHAVVANRVFDVLAAGGRVVSDPVPGLDDLFGGAVPTYEGAEQLCEVVAEVLGDPDATARRTEAARARVLVEHSFDVRAGELIAALAAHGLMVGP